MLETSSFSENPFTLTKLFVYLSTCNSQNLRKNVRIPFDHIIWL